MTEQDHAIQAVKATADALSVSVVIGAILEWIPEATAVLSFIWVLIRLWETKTVRGWFGRE